MFLLCIIFAAFYSKFALFLYIKSFYQDIYILATQCLVSASEHFGPLFVMDKQTTSYENREDGVAEMLEANFI